MQAAASAGSYHENNGPALSVLRVHVQDCRERIHILEIVTGFASIVALRLL